MITKYYFNGKEVVMYSVGQAAARLRRHAATLRRLERQGHIPAPKIRSTRGYRLYTAHEVIALEYAFREYACAQGKELPDEFSQTLKRLFGEIHKHYENKAHPLPLEVSHA